MALSLEKVAYSIDFKDLRVISPCENIGDNTYEFTLYFPDYTISFSVTYTTVNQVSVRDSLEAFRQVILSHINNFISSDLTHNNVYVSIKNLTYTWRDAEEVEHTEKIQVSIKKP